MEPKSDAQLLAEHLAGQAGSFEVLVERYAEDLFGFFQRYVGRAGAADDLVQETFLQVHLSAGTFDPARTFKPWLYTIAANKARDYLRQRGRRATQSLDRGATDADGPTPASLLEAGDVSVPEVTDSLERKDQIRRLIAQMPEQHRMILVLGYYQRLPYAEIADILDIPVGTVKSRLHAAVKNFGRLWLAQMEKSAPER